MATRSLTINLHAPIEHLPAVRASIARYRAACRHMFALFTSAQMAGAEVREHGEDIRVTTDRDRSRLLLGLACGGAEIGDGVPLPRAGIQFPVRVGKAPAYEMRSLFFSDLYPEAKPFVWDSARRQVWSRWAAKDPEFTNASRGWLILQGSRGLCAFHHVGIELTQLTGKPVLTEKTVKLLWDRQIGNVVFEVPRFGTNEKRDVWRSYTWHKICAGDFAPGTVILNQRDGKLRLTVAYECPLEERQSDPERQMKVEFVSSPESSSMVLIGPDGEVDYVSLDDLLAVLNRLRVQTDVWERRRGACGSPRKPWGWRKGWTGAQSHLSRITARREGFSKDQNHALSRRIASRAAMWSCGSVEIEIPTARLLCGHPWSWDNLKHSTGYKLEEVGATLTMTAAKLETPILGGSPRA